MAQAPIGVGMNMPDRQIDDIVKLNVGGIIYSTTRTTLLKYPNSHLAVLVTNPNHIVKRDNDGNIFIDRNGKTFEYILDFLRDEQHIPPIPVYRQVLREASFYGISDHIKVASRRISEIPGAEEIRKKISVAVDYETLVNNIIQKGPKFLILMKVHINTIPLFYENIPELGTGFIHLENIKSEIDAQLVASCLWRDLRSEGFDVDIHIRGICIEQFITHMCCMFTLKDV